MRRVHFDPPGVVAKRRWWAAAALFAALVIGLGWWVWGRSRPVSLPTVPVPMAAALPSLPAPSASLPSAAPSVAAAAPVARVAAPPSAAASAVRLAALRAQRWSWPTGQLVSTLQASASFQAVPSLQRLDLMAEVHGLSAGGGFLSLSPVLRQHACTTQALADPARRERCEALVGRVLAESPSLLDVAIAARVAGSLGWPAERVRASEDQRLALQLALRPANRPEDVYTCEGITRQLRQATAWGTLGETVAARRVIEASGRPLSAWAAEARAEAAARDAAFGGGGPPPR